MQLRVRTREADAIDTGRHLLAMSHLLAARPGDGSRFEGDFSATEQ